MLGANRGWLGVGLRSSGDADSVLCRILEEPKKAVGLFMKHLVTAARKLWKQTLGQDLIEYALMAGFVAVAAGAIMPNVATSISTIFSKVSSVLANAANQGS
jgi:pilus assembly protein Flp/PilA